MKVMPMRCQAGSEGRDHIQFLASPVLGRAVEGASSSQEAAGLSS